MIDVRLLRTDLEGVRARMARRAKPELLVQVDEAAALDVRLREIANERDAARRQVNDLSKQVGQLRRDGKAAEALLVAHGLEVPRKSQVVETLRVVEIKAFPANVRA